MCDKWERLTPTEEIEEPFIEYRRIEGKCPTQLRFSTRAIPTMDLSDAELLALACKALEVRAVVARAVQALRELDYIIDGWPTLFKKTCVSSAADKLRTSLAPFEGVAGD